jgi:ketosteroid isomerase-like protein
MICRRIVIDPAREICCADFLQQQGTKGNTMKIGFTLGFVLLSGLLMARDPAYDNFADASKLIALENAWNQAQLHHDAKAVSNLVSDNFVYTDYDGTVMNKAAFLKDLKDPDYRASLIANDEARVISYVNAAIVVGTYHSKGTYKRQPFEHYGRFTDTWLYQDNKWQCVASHTTLIKK